MEAEIHVFDGATHYYCYGHGRVHRRDAHGADWCWHCVRVREHGHAPSCPAPLSGCRCPGCSVVGWARKDAK